MAHLNPTEGGCWFCCQDEEKEGMYFSFEFDTWVHKSCVFKAKKEGNIEGKIIAQELDL